MAWYAHQYFVAYQQGNKSNVDQAGPSTATKAMGPQDLDYQLAVYCIASGIADLDSGKWKELFDKQDVPKEAMDPEIYGAFDTMRNLYKDVKPSEEVGYSYKVLVYFKKLFSITFLKKITYTYLYHLLGKNII